jgi:hypothetical protein
MVEVGDILNIEGKKFIVTYTDGDNYAFAPYKEVKREEKEVTVEKPVEEKEEIKPRRRRKKED